MADTGATATLTLGTTGAVGTIRKITCPEFSIDSLDASDLASTAWMKMIKTDLANPGEITAEILFDGADPIPLTTLGTAETVTVTFPKVVASNTAGALTGTGFVKAYQMPELETGSLQVSTITIALDGGYNSGTVPTWTAEA